jgi:AcrR family transcriptional regulator
MTYSIPDSQILDAALDVIAQHGYSGATTRQIAAAAGVNAVTLFRRFTSKKGLLLAAVEREAEHFRATGIAYTGDVEADLARVVAFYHELVQHRGRVIAMLLTEIPRQPDLLEILEAPMAIARGVFALIERYQHQGQLIDEPPNEAYAALLGPIFLQVVFGAIRPDIFAGPFDAHQYVRHYLAGRAPRPAGEPLP